MGQYHDEALGMAFVSRPRQKEQGAVTRLPEVRDKEFNITKKTQYDYSERDEVKTRCSLEGPKSLVTLKAGKTKESFQIVYNKDASHNPMSADSAINLMKKQPK